MIQSREKNDVRNYVIQKSFSFIKNMNEIMIKMMKIISISYEKKKNEQMTYLNFYPTNDSKLRKE